MKHTVLIVIGVLFAAVGVWKFWPDASHDKPSSESGRGAKDTQPKDGTPPKLISKLTGDLPTYDRPLDDFPDLSEEGHGELSQNRLKRLWKVLEFGDLPDYIRPLRGYYRARLDTGKLTSRAVAMFQCVPPERAVEFKNELLQRWRQMWQSDPEVSIGESPPAEFSYESYEHRFPAGSFAVSFRRVRDNQQLENAALKIDPTTGMMTITNRRGLSTE